MAANFDSLIIDRVLDGIAEKIDGSEALFRLLNMSNVGINTTSETKDKTDENGVLIKRFFTAKTVELSAESNLLSMSMLAAQNGTQKEIATAENKIAMPKIITFPTKGITEYTLPVAPVAGTISKIYAVNTNGTLGQAYGLNSVANDKSFAYDNESKKITLPTGDNLPSEFFVKYEYESESGVQVVSKADQFPSTIRLTLRVLVADKCSVDTLRIAYITFPSFQISPDCDLTLDTESTQPFSGTAQADYCSSNKLLYCISISEDDVYVA